MVIFLGKKGCLVVILLCGMDEGSTCLPEGLPPLCWLWSHPVHWLSLPPQFPSLPPLTKVRKGFLMSVCGTRLIYQTIFMVFKKLYSFPCPGVAQVPCIARPIKLREKFTLLKKSNPPHFDNEEHSAPLECGKLAIDSLMGF